MKTIPAGLLPEYTGAGSTLCTCLKVTRSDGVIVGVTSLNSPLTVSGVVYQPGYDPGELTSTAGLAVDSQELTVLPDSPGGLAVERPDLVAGLWDNAEFVSFEVNYLSPADGINIIKRGRMGEAQSQRGSFTIEMRALQQALAQNIGAVTSKTCRARLGDAHCRKDLTSFTFTYPTTAVSGAQPTRIFTCAASVAVDGFFDEGIATFTTGANAGYSRKIKSFAADVFTMQLGFPYAIGVGDSVTAIAGCKKRLDEDCKVKFDNVLNFYGEPHLPGIDLLTADPEVDAP